MSRFLGLLAGVSIILLGAGCSAKPKPVSAFARDSDVSQTFDTIAKQVGVTKEGFSFGATNDSMQGKSNWQGNVRYCARSDQIDEVMRAMHAEFTRRIRDSGAEPRGDAPPAAPAAVKGWKITYTAGAQEGTLQVTRNDGKEGQCREKERTEYVVEFVLDEAPKPNP
jgi:hypothetical protein